MFISGILTVKLHQNTLFWAWNRKYIILILKVLRKQKNWEFPKILLIYSFKKHLLSNFHMPRVRTTQKKTRSLSTWGIHCLSNSLWFPQVLVLFLLSFKFLIIISLWSIFSPRRPTVLEKGRKGGKESLGTQPGVTCVSYIYYLTQ